MEKEKELAGIGSIFTETEISENCYIRNFSSEIDEFDLEWHRDKEDRIVEVISNSNWQFQFDNELPIKMLHEIFIPKETFHRLIKGDGELILKITKLV